MGWNRQLEHIQKKMLKVFDLRYQIYTSGKSRERPPKTPPHKGISKCKKTSQNPGEFGWFFTHWTPKRLTYPFAWSRVTHGYRSKCGSKSLGIPKKNLHLSNQYKILVPTKILMLFLGVYFQSSRLVGGYFTAFSCCQASEFGTFWFRTAPHDRSDASGHAGLGGFRKSSGFRRCIAVDFPVAQIENEASWLQIAWKSMRRCKTS